MNIFKKINKSMITIGLLIVMSIGLIACTDDSAKQFTVSFDADNGSTNTSVVVEENTTVAKPADPYKEGYTFLYWTNNGTEFNFYSLVTQDLNLKASYTIDSYTINFDTNGGSELTNSTLTFNYGSEVTFETPTKDGYTFAGWFDGTTEYTSGTWTTVLSTDLNLVAKWVVYYDISYELNGGTNGDNPESFTSEYPITLEDATKRGYEFLGWYTDSGFSNEVTSTSDLTGNVTLYAKFNIATYTISYNLNGGTNGSNPSTYTVENPVFLADASKEGYTFRGWYTSADFSGSAITNLNSYTEDITLYARFTAISYTIHYELYDGENGNNNPYSYTIEDSFTLNDATKSGFEFLGWYTDSEFTNQITSISNSTENITLYAKFTIANYTITYDLNGGVNGDNPSTYNVESSVTLNNPTKTGAVFIGWFTTADFSGNMVSNLDEFTGNITLYAWFDAITYTITYNTDGGSTGNNPSTYTVDTSHTLDNASKNGFEFLGWYTESGFTTKVTSTNDLEGNVTLYAKFTIVTYTVSYELNGGTNGNNASSFTIETSFTLESATKAGYNFDGWYKESTFTTKITSTNDLFENVTLYAKFDVITYSISYELNGGTNGSNPTSYTIEDSFTLNDATKEGYTFLGWYTSSDFANKVTSTSDLDGYVVLYARFTVIIYNISYELNGGVNNDRNPETYAITDYVYLANASKDDASFIGWFTSADFSGSALSNLDGLTGDITLYAKFTTTFFTISYDLDGGTNGENPNNYTSEFSINLENAYKNGYTFEGWFTSADFSGSALSNLDTQSGDITLYAKFEIITYTIYYELDGGTNGSNQTSYTIEDSFTLNDATKDGYTFLGWFTSELGNSTGGDESTDKDEDESEITSIEVGTTGNITLFARWEAI